ncbi:MAG TPA: hypothetical protein VFI28_03595 [Candidatus Limnocylindrales bacterium]|nr:hypothetical protein [Candidatus Limnocylindrales bacterium]
MSSPGAHASGTVGRGPRVILLAAGGIALLLGLTGALVLLGLPMPPASIGLAAGHGMLMGLGFLGTLVALERAVALGRAWGYMAPLGSALGSVALALGGPGPFAFGLFTIAGATFVAIYIAFAAIERSLHLAVETAGAVGWVGAALLLATGRSVGDVVPLLAAFLVLTIVGERLELSRVVLPPRAARIAFIAVAVLFGLGVTCSVWSPGLGVRLAGVGLVGLALWLGRFDLARRTIRARGVTRFIAAALLPGYAWLGVAGAAWALGALGSGGSGYDASIHALFLGFVMSMVFGHAPVILPGVLGIALPYRPRFYGHLVLLHAGLVVRIIGGDLLGIAGAWQLGGVMNVVALLLFVGSSALAIVESARTTHRPTARSAVRAR